MACSPWGRTEPPLSDRNDWLSGEESACKLRRRKRRGFSPQVGTNAREEKRAPHSSGLAWRIPWAEEPGGWGLTESDATENTHRGSQGVKAGGISARSFSGTQSTFLPLKLTGSPLGIKSVRYTGRNQKLRLASVTRVTDVCGSPRVSEGSPVFSV